MQMINIMQKQETIFPGSQIRRMRNNQPNGIAMFMKAIFISYLGRTLLFNADF